MLFKFLRIPKASPLMYQKSFMSHEMAYIFAHAPDPTRSAAFAADAVRQAAGLGGGPAAAAAAAPAAAAAAAAVVVAAPGGADCRPVDPDTDCPICYDGLGMNPSILTYCSVRAGGCGNR